ncbi:autotransporter outer membrane beta-barrel domain-containing protein [Pseudomonas sp. CCC3.2]|uniref:autotransporter outer membrane beta-barrel domain-containing protein n=2 Tax=Pseudomonas TaxID=286 RepID=UPI002AB4B98F|nr:MULTISPECIES: autotransporter outer membrane beta-barrel domain-containing protein [unclassified Pseudomonas]MDY7561019.1 autotransporter outer membrane beta-barrel domain-containing protein [Pseudomonas sp. AB6]MEA9995052.1 autotransporter outer membrane beta-barrel domain-containing protein [Pseudomonas sp. AA4]MEB0086901.1 autotransporter outer membrane beta-barrel domain-containing protein [Pseudomonas sp. RTI1]MEB0126832.1 autotransporter outer membrane beta-barrel domain-containing pro
MESNRQLNRLNLSMAGVALGMSVAGAAWAETEYIVGGVTEISASTENDFQVSGGATFNISGADVGRVAVDSSYINIKGGSISQYGAGGLILRSSVLNAGGTVISNSKGDGLKLEFGAGGIINGPSKAYITDSKISGVGKGVLVGKLGYLELSNTDVVGIQSGVGKGIGIDVKGGTVILKEGSYVLGDSVGMLLTSAGELPGGGRSTELDAITIDNSIVQSTYGSAITVDEIIHSGNVSIGGLANIVVQNESTLLSGNGNLLEVKHVSTANLKVDNSTLTGNLVADDTSTLNVTLQNNASLTGDVINGNNLAVNSGAQWQMVGDNAVKTMSLDGSQVRFGLDGFHTLSLGQLSGSGVFGMKIDLDAGLGDLLNVNGQANGNFTLAVKNTGTEPVSPDLQPLQIVHTEGGDAQFNLLGEKVDLGAYSYELEKQGNDWFIVGSGKTISPSTQSVLALFNAAPTVFMSELTTLRSRMGEVRGSEEGGGWMRAYGSRFDAATGAGIKYKQQQRGMSFGADAPVPIGNGHLLLGVLGGYSTTDLDLSHGTSGKVDSYYVGAYGTWLSEEGYYVDAVLKLNKFRNESKVAMSDQTKAEGDYNNTAVGGSVEVGKHIKLGDDYFIEPFAQMEAVVVQGDHYRLDNGLEAKNDRTQSILGKVGSSVGRNIALKDGGVLRPYLRAAVAHEFARSNRVSVNETSFDNDLFGSRAELGVGLAVSLSKNLQVHADFDYMKGNNVEQPWGANVGIRLAF